MWTRSLLAMMALGVGSQGCAGTFHRGPMPGEPKDATFLEIEGTRVRYTDRGEGPPVVLIHGFASSLETWLTVAPVLEKKHRVISLDLKGFGWTDRPEGDYSPAAQARLVFGLLDARGIERTAVVAHSWGSSVALAMALAQPARVTRIALYDAWVFEEQLPTFFLWSRSPGLGELLFGMFYTERPDEKIARAFYDQRYVTYALVSDVQRALERPGTVAAALAAVRGQRFAEVQPRYRTITQPTLLLWGREDEVTTLPFGERLARELPNCRLVVYPRCGHFPMIEAASASTAELAAFLAAEGAP
ncbi:MAG: alpha/beta fold hydrolase [Myxococcales bacterium]|nr:alpha/beta fold hydrolase [Polyangiaceae bacterium]MDW8248842.1 alpha/beta fold hydrolase [Myxococcales bacterium]